MTGPESLEVAAAKSPSPIRTKWSSRGDRRRPYTKLHLVRYYLSVADGALRGRAGRPMILKRS